MTQSFAGLKSRWEQERKDRSALSRETRARIGSPCVPIFQRYGVRKVLLYGSVAEDRATDRSDVDLLLLPLENASYWEFLHEMEDALERAVDLYTDRDEQAWVQKILNRFTTGAR